MAGITRATAQLFSTTGLTPSGGFGAPANGVVTTEAGSSNTLANIQTGQSGQWAAGWLAATLGSTKFPTIEDMNAAFNVFSTQIAYLLERGIPEYDAGTTYNIGDITRAAAATQLYISAVNSNTGNALTNASYWTTGANLSAAGGYSIIGQASNIIMNVTTASATASVTASEIIVGSSLGGATTKLGSYSQSVNLATTGAGGMDTGSAPANGFVSLYAIYGTSGTSIVACNANTSTTPEYSGSHMPSGYTQSGLLGTYPTNGSSQFIVLSQINKTIYISGVQVLSGGTATSSTPFSISSAVPPNATSCGGQVGFGGGAAYAQIQANNFGLGAQGFAVIATVSSSNFGFSGMPIVTSQYLSYAITVNSGSPSISVVISSYSIV